MAAHEEPKEPTYKIPQLLHPELLSLDEIKSILTDRCIKLNNIHSMSKEQLVAVMHRVAVPFPQRQCFATTAKRKFAFASRSFTNSATITAKRDPNPTNKRLSDCIDYKKKTIKIRRTSDDICGPEIKAEKQKLLTSKLLDPEAEKNNLTSLPANSETSPEESHSPSKKSRVKISWP